MKRLNNKGMTIVEILVCFILVMTITASLYSTISMYNQKKHEEDIKQSIYKYKILITKEIYDTIIDKHLKSATVDDNKITLTLINNYQSTITFNSNSITMYDGIKNETTTYKLPTVKEKTPQLTFDLDRKKIVVDQFIIKIDVRIKTATFGEKYGIKINAPTNVDNII